MDYFKLLAKVFTAELGAKVFLGLISILCIRFMPTEEFATYAFSISVFVVITSIVSSVINVVYVASEEEFCNYYQTTFFVVQLALIAIVFLPLSYFQYLFGKTFFAVLYLCIVHFLFLYGQSYYQKRMNFSKYYRLEYIRVLLFFVGFVTLLLLYGSKLTAISLISVQILATLLPVLLTFFSIIKLREIFSFEKFWYLLKYLFSPPDIFLIGYFTFVILLMNMDLAFLRKFSSTENLAIYGAAARYYAVLQMALISIHKIMLPMITRIKEYGELVAIFEQHKSLAKKLLLLTPVIYFGGEYIIPFINDYRYPDAVAIFFVLSLSSYFSFYFSPFVNILIKEKEYKYMFSCAFSAVIIHATVLYNVVPNYPAIGVAFSNLFSFGMFNFSIYLKARRVIFTQGKSS